MEPPPRRSPGPEDLDIEITSSPAKETLGEDPAHREGRELLSLGRPTHDPRFLLRYPSLEQILAHGQQQKDTEVGGVLLGRIWRCARGRVTEVTESVPAERTEAGLGHVTFSHETWQEIYNELDRRPPELRIVGWYHTHPGFGVFYSEHDRFIQRHFFAGEGQLGVVVDPQQLAIAGYEIWEGEVRELPGLLVCAEAASVEAARELLRRLTFAGGRKTEGILRRLSRPLRNPTQGNGGLRQD